MNNHRCVVADSNDEVLEKLASFALAGMNEKAFVLGFLREEEIRNFFEIIEKQRGGGRLLKSAISESRLSIRTHSECFFSNGQFSTQTALESIGKFYSAAKAGGFGKFHAFGNATFIMERPPGYGDFFGFESRLTPLASADRRIKILCGYARFAFPEALLEEALRIHS